MHHFAAALILAAAAFGQGRVWIVDAANGSGTHFTDLVSAQAAVAPGDILRVRAGRYPGFTTNKGTAIIGEGLVRIVTALHSLPPSSLRVHGLPADQAFSLANVIVDIEHGSLGMVIENAAGRVHLDDVTVWNWSAGTSLVTGLEVRDAAFVTVRGGAGIVGVALVRTTGTFAACPLAGPDSINSFGGRISPNGPAVFAVDSTVQFARCNLRGGNGGISWVP